MDCGLTTLSQCGGFEVVGRIDDNQVLLRGPSEDEVVLDRRDEVPGDG